MQVSERDRRRVLTLSTVAFTALFAVWLMLGVLSVPIRAELGLSEVQVGWLAAIAVLNGALFRLAFGIWTDRIGGRLMMTALLLATAVPCALVSRADSYGELMLAAALYGFAGNGFSVGVAWCSAWFPPERQGFALGIFGAGNVGASVTKVAGPTLIALVSAPLLGGLVPAGWRAIPVLYAAMLVVLAAATWLLSPSQDLRPGKGRSLASTLGPLREIRVWRFSLYYVVVFGAYVALSVWLPKYYVDVYGLSLRSAALLAALFIFPASLLRPLGGYLS
ncbi:MAG: MFS transporter, partial [Deltaproteobacteria bacterium]|nr:MFS transporter [Deltaproteobacteria bacterium]